ncbi:MAG: hypothetical protein J6V72_20735 [Kiritimatiellae bacterium]|nr:hypothetical protein [Kiritimatiellia bacterium]
MKKLFAILIAVFSIAANAGTLTLSPGLSEPLGGDGALVEAAVLVSTNASATATVQAVYDLPVYGVAESVSIITNDVLTFVTNSVVVTNFSASVTSNYVVTTAYGLTSTNYYTVATNSVAAYVPRPGAPVITTNRVLTVTSTVAVTNSLFSLTASSGFAETNDVKRCLAPGARLLLTGAPVTIFLR